MYAPFKCALTRFNKKKTSFLRGSKFQLFRKYGILFFSLILNDVKSRTLTNTINVLPLMFTRMGIKHFPKLDMSNKKSFFLFRTNLKDINVFVFQKKKIIIHVTYTCGVPGGKAPPKTGARLEVSERSQAAPL